MPPRALRGTEEEDVTNRALAAKPDNLHGMEVVELDEEDSGWAGHHEEVDYTKVCCARAHTHTHTHTHARTHTHTHTHTHAHTHTHTHSD